MGNSIHDKLTALADFIRDKYGITNKLSIDDMIEIIPELGSKSDKDFIEYISLSNPNFNYNYNNYINTDLVVPSAITELNSSYNIFNNNNGISTNNLITNNVETINSVGTSFKYIDMSSNKLKNIINSFNYTNNDNTILNFPDSLEVIRGSFKKNYNIESITFGDNIKIIEDSFYRCYVKHAYFPDKPILLNGVGFLDRYTSIGSIDDDNIEQYGEYFYVLKGTHILINYVDQDIINIPEGITSIGECCFLNSNATQINIPNTVVAIGDRAFCNCTNLLEITIPESVTMIGCNVFVGCSRLQKININYNTLEYIGKTNTWGTKYPALVYLAGNNNILNCDNFYPLSHSIINTYVSNEIPDHKYENESFSDFILTNNITKIGKYAFANNLNLSAVHIAANKYNLSVNDYYTSNLEYIDDYAFYNTNLGTPLWSLYYTKSKLRYIGKYAFAECKKLGYNGYTIPYSVVEIDDYAFYNSGSNGNSISMYFENYTNDPNSLSKPSQLKRIGKYAFAVDSSYKAKSTSTTIPASVTEIDDYAFYNQSKLKTITFENGSNLKRIGKNAFNGCTALTSIVIPEGVTEIGGCAFMGCSSLTSITLPSTLIKIGYGAFANCYNLASFELPSNVTNIIDKYGNAYYDNDYSIINRPTLIIPVNSKLTQTIYQMFTNEENIDLPVTITKIEPYSFYNVTNTLKTINITGADEICHHAFNNCKKLTSITIPRTVTKIGTYAFNNCILLENITINEGITQIDDYAFNGCTSLTSITIPEGVTTIGDYAFSGCTSLTSVTLPSTLTSIGYYAFINCRSLANVTILSNDIEMPLFSNTLIKNIMLSEGVTTIGDYAFNGCTAITNITIPEGVTTISDYAFSGCTSLTSVTLPSTLIKIGHYAFNGCTALTSITIPEGVTTIGNYVFSGCTALTSVTIPSTFISVGYSIFNGCTSLERISNITNKCNNIDISYTGVADINEFINNNMVSIPNSFFSNCNNLTNITIPENINLIGSYAFFSCSNIKTIRFLNENICINNHAFSCCSSLDTLIFKNNNCKYINDNAFNGCTSLKVLNMPNYIFMGDYAFSGCTSLEEINFSYNISTITSENTFYGCTSLKRVIIPENIIGINNSTFTNCSNLKYIYAHNNVFIYLNNSNIIKYICKYVNNYPSKLMLWDYNNSSYFNLGTYPANVISFGRDFTQNRVLDIENAETIVLETEYPVAFDSNTTFVSFKFIPEESGIYYITATNIVQSYNGAPAYSFYLYDFTDETCIYTYFMGDASRFFTNLIAEHEYYYSISTITATSGDVHIHKYNDEFIKYAIINSNIINRDFLTNDDLKNIKLYIKYDTDNYEITMNQYIPIDENDTCDYLSYYGNINKNPYAANIYNCTENVSNFPFFIYIDTSKNLFICTDPLENDSEYYSSSNPRTINVEVLTDIPEEVWDNE